MAEIAIVHLVRRSNGLAPLERFISSYRRYPAGREHDLIMIFKGFASGQVTPDYDHLLSGIPHHRLYLADYGFDLRPYFKAVESFDYKYFCFFNSFSRILAPEWLAKLHRWAATDGTGLVGATASYQSFSTDSAERQRKLGKLGIGERMKWRIRHIFKDPQPNLVVQRAAAWILGELGLWRPSRHFRPFPNYHIRTNAFMASGGTLKRVCLGSLRVKLSAYMFESGWNNMTDQITRMGLRPLVVDRDGNAYEREEWHRAETFWQGRQENLLVADNQTDAYAYADFSKRQELSRFAWGPHARPGRDE